MNRLLLNSRDELLIVDLEKVAFMRANGNYSELYYIEGQKMLVSLSLSKLEALVQQAMKGQAQSTARFVRLGRSLIVNQRYLVSVSVTKQKIVLSDLGKNIFALAVSKSLARQYKERLSPSPVNQALNH